uniref:Uncharacterized protein n=2 Tax=Amphimedon queenslandica TaxID=400682 RepID=A0A1X7T3D4_AMPQE
MSNVASSVGGALAVHFFETEFQEFHTLLNTEILLMYLHYDLVDGMISERDFAHMILRHTSLSEQKKKQMVKRVKKKFGPKLNPARKVGVNFEAELNEACKAVTGLSVSSHLVDVLFTIFDENITRIRTSQTNELWCGLLCKAVKDKLGIEA